MTDRVLFTNAQVIGPSAVLAERSVLCERRRIAALGPPAARAHGARIVDCGGDLLAPGSIDVHIHGAAGAMVEEATPEAVERIACALPRYGVTGFLPTFATMDLDALRRGLVAVRAAGAITGGARVLGVHLEGPYLNPACAGAQPVGFMREPQVAELESLLDTVGDLVRLVTLAPELPHAIEVIRLLRRRGIVVSAGHTAATSAEIQAGIAAGISHATHLFNAMRGIHHREPGAAGALLGDDGVTAELICDGHHLAPDIVRLVLRAKPAERVVLITDAVAPMGLGEGEFEMFGVRCIVREGAVRLAEGDILAGSVLSVDQAIRNLRMWAPDIPLHQLWSYAARNPAGELGMPEYGRIVPGAAADLVRYTPALTVRETYVGATRVYAAESKER